eukprot:TRINITY_DN27896_c0_g1_i1.p1 TRINITY_DN27896_c0_g1~~TRINITY_DN27896_c0_g1_i1.p1  ORF type:complete len:178 (+),score=16.24 TRINITY_DN27896_c0_g1_i1:83-616(+)
MTDHRTTTVQPRKRVDLSEIPPGVYDFHDENFDNLADDKARRLRTANDKFRDFIFSFAVATTCGYIVYASRLLSVMYSSVRIHRALMYLALTFFAGFWVILMYVYFFVRPSTPKGRDWTLHPPWAVPTATALGVGGFVFLTVALWPVFHLLTVPLLIVAIAALLNMLMMWPSVAMCS